MGGAASDAAQRPFDQCDCFDRLRPPGGVRLQQVQAHLALGQYDGAAEALTPVLRDTPPEHRVRPLLQRLDEVHTQSLTCEQPREPILCTMREAITDFRRQAVVAELIT